MAKSRWALLQRLVVGTESNPMLIRWRIVGTVSLGSDHE